MVFLMSFVAFNFPSIWALENNMRVTIILCAVAMIIGTWLRFFAIKYTDNFYVLLASQSLIAISQPFVGNAASKLAT